MDEREFVVRHRAAWEQLGDILKRAGYGAGLRHLPREDVQQLGPLYRRAATDLAWARAHAVSGDLVRHLNALVAQSYALLYQTDTRSWSGLRRFFTHEFPQAFRRRLSFFYAAVALLVLGAVVGFGLVHQSRDNMDLLLPPGTPLHDSIAPWESGKVSRDISGPEGALMSSMLMQNNIRVSFVAYAVGILGGVFTSAIMFSNGCIVGGLYAIVAHSHQLYNFWSAILPHGVVELSETCIAGGAGLSLGWALIVPGPYRRRDALISAALDSVKLVLGGILLLIFAGLVEAYVSHSLLPRPFKLGFGIASGIALYSYLFLAGREAPAPAKPAMRATSGGS